MKYTTISQLTESNTFEVQRTSNNTTVITSTQPFEIEASAGWVKANLNENNQFEVIFSGLCSNDRLPNAVSLVTKNPLLIQAILESAKLDSQPKKQNDLGSSYSQTTFDRLKNNTTFKLNESGPLYKKTGPSSFTNADLTSIGSRFPFVAKPDREVLVVEDFDTSLDDQQKRDLVDFIDSGLSREEFVEQVAMQLEDVPGVELYTSEQLSALYSELYALYTSG